MTETVKNDNKLKDFFIRTMTDPVLIYVAILVSSVMYHYRDSLALAYGAASYAAGWLLFRLFDFMKKHKVVGFLLYVVVGWFFLYLMGLCQETGRENYPISFALWFFTPQDSLQYNKWYTLEIFLFFTLFMASVFYFFTKVQYRIFMTFLIMIIPFSIYGKEYEEMPIYYIMALAVGFIVILVKFRQLGEDKNVVVVDKAESWKSGLAFVAIFATLAAIIPKPEITADRTIIETLINADAFTDRLVSMLNVFRDTATGEQFRGQADNTPLYYANSNYDLRLKTASYTKYDYEKDSWYIGRTDNECYEMTGQPFEVPMNGGLCDVLLYAAELDSDFAERYNLSEFVGFSPIYPEKEEISIYASYKEGTRFPVPEGVCEVLESSYKKNILVSESGVVMTSGSDSKFRYNETFKYSYYPDLFFENEKNRAVVDAFSRVGDYQQMIQEAGDIIENAPADDYEKISSYRDIIRVNKLYSSFEYDMLDYGNNENIYNLAQEITAGLRTDYEKAEALEWYFINSGYVYDLSYRKDSGDNAEDFLFRTKKGVCYEYATAMTLLARAAGIPARYCEGFNMSTKYENSRNNTTYVVTGKDAHGFPELYMKGFGWVTFEPTRTYGDVSSEKEDRNAMTMLSRMGVIILSLCVLAIIVIFAYPVLEHKFFIFSNNRKSPDRAVAGVIHRVCRLYSVPVSSTSNQAKDVVKRTSGADISETARLFDKAEYGGAELTEDDKMKAMSDYLSAYDALNEVRKEARRQKRRKK